MTRGAAGISTSAIAERGDSVCSGGGGGGDGYSKSFAGRSVAIGVVEDRSSPPHHSGAIRGAVGFLTGAATSASACGGGF